MPHDHTAARIMDRYQMSSERGAISVGKHLITHHHEEYEEPSCRATFHWEAENKTRTVSGVSALFGVFSGCYGDLQLQTLRCIDSLRDCGIKHREWQAIVQHEGCQHQVVIVIYAVMNNNSIHHQWSIFPFHTTRIYG